MYRVVGVFVLALPVTSIHVDFASCHEEKIIRRVHFQKFRSSCLWHHEPPRRRRQTSVGSYPASVLGETRVRSPAPSASKGSQVRFPPGPGQPPLLTLMDNDMPSERKLANVIFMEGSSPESGPAETLDGVLMPSIRASSANQSMAHSEYETASSYAHNASSAYRPYPSEPHQQTAAPLQGQMPLQSSADVPREEQYPYQQHYPLMANDTSAARFGFQTEGGAYPGWMAQFGADGEEEEEERKVRVARRGWARSRERRTTHRRRAGGSCGLASFLVRSSSTSGDTSETRVSRSVLIRSPSRSTRCGTRCNSRACRCATSLPPPPPPLSPARANAWSRH